MLAQDLVPHRALGDERGELDHGALCARATGAVAATSTSSNRNGRKRRNRISVFPRWRGCRRVRCPRRRGTAPTRARAAPAPLLGDDGLQPRVRFAVGIDRERLVEQLMEFLAVLGHDVDARRHGDVQAGPRPVRQGDARGRSAGARAPGDPPIAGGSASSGMSASCIAPLFIPLVELNAAARSSTAPPAGPPPAQADPCRARSPTPTPPRSEQQRHAARPHRAAAESGDIESWRVIPL